MLQWAGPCFDLPHHPSTREEVGALCAQLATIIDAAGKQTQHQGRQQHHGQQQKQKRGSLRRPAIVTIARSVFDDFTPAKDVGFIEEAVMGVLRAAYGELDVTIDVESDDEGEAETGALQEGEGRGEGEEGA